MRWVSCKREFLVFVVSQNDIKMVNINRYNSSLVRQLCYATLVTGTFYYLFCLQARKWICAENADGKYISTYARNNPGEDFAESAVPWFALRYKSSRVGQADIDKVKSTMPNRIQYFDDNLGPKFPK